MIAVIYFPGNNCEEETKTAVNAVGMDCKIIRWNENVDLNNYKGYVLVGGWAYEDRIRAGVIASKDPMMDQIKEQAKKNKPVLGICNGAQVLVESGLVPDTTNQLKNEMALAPNKDAYVQGFYCTWLNIKVVRTNTAFTSNLTKNDIIPIPIAHAEGRFTTKDPINLSEHIVFTYCDEKGNTTNPNGSINSIAGLSNKTGNVLAMMPHPERACFKRNLPYEEQKTFDNLLKHAKAMKIFESMRDYIQ